jgi:hypothetical protein
VVVTASIGLATIAILWIPIPILHFLNIERFELPPDLITCLAIFGNVLGGVFFNAGFMLVSSSFECSQKGNRSQMIALYGSVLAVRLNAKQHSR